MDLPEERALLERFRRGERAALEEVYYRHVDQVALVARCGFTTSTSEGPVHITGAREPDAVRELVQETFVRAFAERSRLAYDGLRPYAPYLLRITRNLMIDRKRGERRERTPAGDDAPGLGDLDELLARGGALPEPPTQEDDLHWRSLRAFAEEYTASLDAEARAFVRLRFEEELSQEAAAARLGASRRRVRTLEDRILKGLSRFLKKKGVRP